MNRVGIRRGAAVLVLVSACMTVAVLSSAGSAGGETGTVGAARGTDQTRPVITLCFVYNREASQGCKNAGAATAPPGVVHGLLAQWDARAGDLVRIIGVQTDPVRRRLGRNGVLLVCLGVLRCRVDAGPPQRGKIVAAEYQAVLTRGGRRFRSNVIRLTWSTPRVPTSVTLEGPGFICTERLPNPGDRVFCRGTTETPGGERVVPVPAGSQVQLTAQAQPELPEGWSLQILGGGIICRVPAQHPTGTNGCTGYVDTGALPRENRQWGVATELRDEENGYPVGTRGIGVTIWWGCPIRGLIPQCP
jgi:hypothetical protein